VATLAGNATSYMDSTVAPGVQYFYQIKAIDTAGTSPASNALSVTTANPRVVSVAVFYNESTFDGQNGSSNLTDDNAVATDKTPLLPGQSASFANYTSYSKGLNGVMVNVADLLSVPRIDDFDFEVGNNSNVATWTQAPSPTYVNAYPGRGPNGSTQITLIWNDNAIQNEWLKVTMLANDHTGLPANYVFYFGNAIGETGDSTTNALVTSNDATRVGANFTASASVTNIYDINRDGVVNATDVSLVNANLTTGGNELKLISFTTPPSVAMPASASPSYITGTNTTLHVLGNEAVGEPKLTYTWTTIGTPPAPVTFSDNGTNTAKNATATFTSPGIYILRVTVSDPVGATTTDSVSVIVAASLSAIDVVPDSASPPVPTALASGSTEQFTASGLDQFGQPISMGTPTWTIISGGGSIDSNGLYTSPYAIGSATIQAVFGTATGTATVMLSGQAQWNSAANGSWNNGNWIDSTSGAVLATPGLRGIPGDMVLFSTAAGHVVRLDGVSPSVAGVTFNNSGAAFTISQGTGGVLHLANGSDSAAITVSAGNHTISAPVALDSRLTILPAAGSQLNISGGITGSSGLTVNGQGTVVLSGANAYAGGTTVSLGTLVVTNPGALLDGSALTVGAGTDQFFAPIVPAPAPVVASAVVAAAADTTPAPSAIKTASFPVPVTPNAADLVHARVAAVSPTRTAAAWAWLGKTGSIWDNIDDSSTKDATVRAFDAVFAQYGN
jgi:autotransporter-associated beta strand protein